MNTLLRGRRTGKTGMSRLAQLLYDHGFNPKPFGTSTELDGVHVVSVTEVRVRYGSRAQVAGIATRIRELLTEHGMLGVRVEED